MYSKYDLVVRYLNNSEKYKVTITGYKNSDISATGNTIPDAFDNLFSTIRKIHTDAN